MAIEYGRLAENAGFVWAGCWFAYLPWGFCVTGGSAYAARWGIMALSG